MKLSPTVQQMVHEQWKNLTDDGKADSTVYNVRSQFAAFKATMRARFNISAEVLSALEEVEEYVVHETKTHIICGGVVRGFTIPPPIPGAETATGTYHLSDDDLQG